MTNEELIPLITETIESMMGHTYMCGSSQHTFSRYRINEEKGRVHFFTDKKEFDRPIDATMEFLDQFEPVLGRQMATVPQYNVVEMPKRQVDGSVIKELKDILLDNIKKVKEDKNYIQQAESIKQNVDGIIELAKTEIAYMQAYTRMNKM